MPDIRPIETLSAGHRFRSRLEARWAVFFDHVNIKWEYEPEGYETSAGWYLPDFRLDPRQVGEGIGELFFEVKGAALRQDEAERIAALVSDDLEARRFVIPLGSIPDPRNACPEAWHCTPFLSAWGADQSRAGGGYVHFSPVESLIVGGVLGPFQGPIEARRMAHAFTSSGFVSPHCSCGSMRTPCPNALSSPIGKALTAARSARFEHGETPARP